MGKGKLRNELLAGFRAAAKPLVADAKASAAGTLPASGGLAARIAGGKFSTRTRAGRANLGIRIVSANGYDLPAIDAGTVRHPVYGNRKAWASQSVTPGWFTKPMEASGPAVRGELQKVMIAVARQIEG